MPGGGEWINTIGEGEQEKRKRAFAETLQSQEPTHWIWKGELEACTTGEACIISGILCKGPPGPVVLRVQIQCISLGLGEMTSLQESVIAWLTGNDMERNAWRGTGDQSLLETSYCRIQKYLPANLMHACIWDLAEMTKGCLASDFYHSCSFTWAQI